jgi:hypothetical protein
MIHIPVFLFDKNITKNIKHLINIGYKSFNDLIDFDKEKLIVQIIDSLGNDAYNLIIDSPHFDKTLSYLKDFLISDSVNSAFSLAKTIRRNAIEYYTDDLNNLFDYWIHDQMELAS